MTSKAVRCLSILAFALLAACSSDAGSATQIVVTVTSDLTIPAEMDRVTLSVGGNATAPEATADLTMKDLPRSVGFVHDHGNLGPFVIKASGYLGTKLVVEKQVSTYFLKGKTIELSLKLERACKGMFCAEGLTCETGTCGPISPDDPGADAGASTGIDGGSSAGDSGTTNGGTTPDGGAGDGAASGGAPPTCNISLPMAEDAYQTGQPLALTGTCTDPESGALSVGLLWTSNLDGQLGRGTTASASLRTTGDHTIKLCAADPLDSSSIDCDEVVVRATATPQPQVSITSIQQSNSTMQPFRDTSPLSFLGVGTGAGIVLDWSDSIRGPLGTGSMASMTGPDVGKHVVTLLGTDRNAVKVSVTQSYTVLADGKDALVASYTSANGTLANNGGSANVATLGIDPSDRVYAAANGKLYGLAADQANPPTSIALNAPPLQGSVQDVFIDVAAQLAYVGTSAGLTVCNYVAAAGIGAPCTTYKDGDLQSNSVKSVVRMVGTNNTTYLLVGTSDGLLKADSVLGSSTGNNALDGRSINALVASAGLAWAATDDGLYRYNPISGQSQRFSTDQGAPSKTLTSLAVDSAGNIWVGSSNGLARFVPGANSWTIWRTADGLISNGVNAVAVANTQIGGVARDVIWVATNAGVSRFDPTIPSFMSLTSADGLPSNTVRDVVVLSNGTKVFATASGIARYEGP